MHVNKREILHQSILGGKKEVRKRTVQPKITQNPEGIIQSNKKKRKIHMYLSNKKKFFPLEHRLNVYKF